MTSPNLIVAIMGAGQGTRMKSPLPKVLHPFHGEPMVHHVIRASIDTSPSPQRLILIIGHEREQVKEEVRKKWGNKVEFAIQDKQLGTGHAINQLTQLLTDSDQNGEILVLSGDSPAITAATLTQLMDTHRLSESDATVLTNIVENPIGYGRILRNSKTNEIERIVEEKDIENQRIRDIHEVNTGFYIFNTRVLFDILPTLKNDNKAGEYYLTDVIRRIIEKEPGGMIGSMRALFKYETEGINTPEQLTRLETLTSANRP